MDADQGIRIPSERLLCRWLLRDHACQNPSAPQVAVTKGLFVALNSRSSPDAMGRNLCSGLQR